jgi:hypothetical protein
VQAIRRSAERAFVELRLRDCATFKGWVLLDQEGSVRSMLQRYVDDAESPPPLVPRDGYQLPEEDGADEDLMRSVRPVPEVRLLTSFCTNLPLHQLTTRDA